MSQEMPKEVAEFVKRVEKEIADHPDWCSPTCPTFLPQAYRNRRFQGTSAQTLQNDYDSCHIFR